MRFAIIILGLAHTTFSCTQLQFPDVLLLNILTTQMIFSLCEQLAIKARIEIYFKYKPN